MRENLRRRYFFGGVCFVTSGVGHTWPLQRSCFRTTCQIVPQSIHGATMSVGSGLAGSIARGGEVLNGGQMKPSVRLMSFVVASLTTVLGPQASAQTQSTTPPPATPPAQQQAQPQQPQQAQQQTQTKQQ